ncbi:VanZ family protein [Vibrio sp. PID17_43]|uniref:VanZ family protein n=1 Tax=unclassified Vibrio TaxID=2614977 RepID=UPI000BFFF916|nr:VanZ family protein [Vibrio sp. PID17_43]PHJ43563.1 hypothetical protein AK965_01070 [Vibrio sp. PID17_43]
MDRISKVPLIILIVSIFVFGGASVFKSSGLFFEQIRTIETTIGGSIYLHLCASFFMGGFCRLVTKKNLLFALPPTTLVAFALVMIDELLQLFIASRGFSWMDILANLLGVLLGTYFVNIIMSVWAFILEHRLIFEKNDN